MKAVVTGSAPACVLDASSGHAGVATARRGKEQLERDCPVGATNQKRFSAVDLPRFA
jgi:hypothetical protein